MAFRSNASPASLASLRDTREFDEVDIGLVAPLPAVTSTHYDPHPSPLDNSSASDPDHPHHQRSMTSSFFDSCRPLMSKAATTLHSPKKSLASFLPARDSSSDLSSWFAGASAPIHLGINQRKTSPHEQYAQEEDYDHEDYDERSSNGSNGSNSMAHFFSRSSNQATRAAPSGYSQQSSNGALSWIANKLPGNNSSASAPSGLSPQGAHDELLTLDIQRALFPHGPADPLAPSSFHDLLSSAEILLARYQAAYRHQATVLRDTQAELDAQDDELDEADTRARHLKQQLDDMADRAAEQDRAMQALTEELMAERKLREEEEQARLNSIALVKSQRIKSNEKGSSPRRNGHHRERSSAVSSHSISDSGFESESEFEADDTVSSTSSPFQSPVLGSEEPFSTKNPQLTRRSTYDRVLHTYPQHNKLTGSAQVQEHARSCANCEQGPHASAWSKVAEAREQNLWLRRRVQELETAVDGALDVVALLG